MKFAIPKFLQIPHAPGRRSFLKTSAALATTGLMAGCGGNDETVKEISKVPEAKKPEPKPKPKYNYDFSTRADLKAELDNLEQYDAHKIYTELNAIRDEFIRVRKGGNVLDSSKDKGEKFSQALHALYAALENKGYQMQLEISFLCEALTLKKLDCDTGTRLAQMMFRSVPELGLDIYPVSTCVNTDPPKEDHVFMRSSDQPIELANGNKANVNFDFQFKRGKQFTFAYNGFADDQYTEHCRKQGFSQKDMMRFGMMRPLSDDEITAGVYSNLGIDALGKDQFTEALEFLKKAKDLAPKRTNIQVFYAGIAGLLGNREEADPILKHWANQGYTNAAKTLRDFYYKQDKNPVRALQALNAFIQKYPNLAPAYMSRAELLMDHPFYKPVGTIQDLKRYIKITNPEMSEGEINGAIKRSLQGHIRELETKGKETAAKNFRTELKKLEVSKEAAQRKQGALLPQAASLASTALKPLIVKRLATNIPRNDGCIILA